MGAVCFGPMSSPEQLYVIDDERFDAHASNTPHPERPARLSAVRTGLVSTLRQGGAELIAPRLASDEELLPVHTLEHIEELKQVLGRGHGHIDEDTFISEGTRTATWLAAGGAAVMTERLLASDSAAFVLAARPPGHHATRTTAMGFCLLNNVAVAAAAALARGVERVAILDWDVHHGNGTQAIFEHDPRVLFISLHQWPLYPGTGTSAEIGLGEGRGRTINVPLPQGCSGRDYDAAMKRVVLPVLEQFEPELMLVSSGFDAHRDDPLGGMLLGDDDFGAFTNMTWDLTRKVGANRLGIVLEGGYDLGALERAGHSVAEALLGKRFQLDEAKIGRATEQAIDDTRKALSGYWQL
jgi:acetoin utilization deacetylase AcuC-like enzyme